MKNYAIILFAIFLLWSCSESETPQETNETTSDLIVLTTAQVKQAGIEWDTVRSEFISGTILLQGKVEAPPQNLISISVPLGGYLKSTDLLPGMKVQKGQRLTLLEDPQYVQLQQDYLTGKIKLGQLESEFKRQSELYGQKAQSEKVYRQVESEYLSQKVMVKALEEKLGLIGIDYRRLNDSTLFRTVSMVSPVTGFISKVNANIGKYIPPGDILFELVDVSDIHLALKIFEQDLQHVAIGQKLQAFTSFNPDKKYSGEIIAIGHSLDEEKSTMIHCHFQSYDPALVPGMYMRAEIATHPANAITLPESALILSGNRAWLAEALSDTTFQLVSVKKGVQQGDRVEVISDQVLANRKWVIKGGGWIKLKRENKE